ncbi:MAG: response regulator [Pyrinomonadaceae bacterium]|nr:response regulator [Pyrinomonadaceae bacterium]
MSKITSKMPFNKKNSIFIVEDDQIVAKLLKHTLTRRGYLVEVAHSGREAIEKLDELPPNLILLDIILPHFDGFEILKKIRAKNEWSEVPTIMLTSKTQELNVVRAFDCGANDYVTKPFQMEELVARIRRLTS